jgi:hypothetical protein
VLVFVCHGWLDIYGQACCNHASLPFTSVCRFFFHGFVQKTIQRMINLSDTTESMLGRVQWPDMRRFTQMSDVGENPQSHATFSCKSDASNILPPINTDISLDD